ALVQGGARQLERDGGGVPVPDHIARGQARDTRRGGGVEDRVVGGGGHHRLRPWGRSAAGVRACGTDPGFGGAARGARRTAGRGRSGERGGGGQEDGGQEDGGEEGGDRGRGARDAGPRAKQSRA